MATTESSPAATSQGYQLEGSLLEVCNCETLCPCWIGEDPDNGICAVGDRVQPRRGARSAAWT